MRDVLDAFDRRIDPNLLEPEMWNDLPQLEAEEKRALLKILHEKISNAQKEINECRKKQTTYTIAFEKLAFSQMMLFWMYDVIRNGRW